MYKSVVSSYLPSTINPPSTQKIYCEICHRLCNMIGVTAPLLKKMCDEYHTFTVYLPPLFKTMY